VLARVIEAFGEAAFGEELLFELAKLAVEQIVGLVDQADQRVGRDLGRSLLDIGPIGRIGPIARVGKLSDCLCLLVVLGPERQTVLAQEVLIVDQQLFQARAGDADQLELGLLRSAGSLTALGDVLLARAGGLNHLIGRARTPVDEAGAEGDRAVVDDLGTLVRLEPAVPAVSGDHAAGIGPIGRIRPIGPTGPIRPIWLLISPLLHAQHNTPAPAQGQSRLHARPLQLAAPGPRASLYAAFPVASAARQPARSRHPRRDRESSPAGNSKSEILISKPETNTNHQMT